MQMKTANNGTHEYLLTSHYALGIGAEQITGFICPINSEAVRWGKAAPSWGRRGEGLPSAQRERGLLTSGFCTLQPYPLRSVRTQLCPALPSLRVPVSLPAHHPLVPGASRRQR